MKGLYNNIGKFTNGNMAAHVVEWRQDDDIEYEMILVVDGNAVSFCTRDVPRMVSLLKDALGCAAERLEELVKDEVPFPA